MITQRINRILQALIVSHAIYGILTIITLNIRPFTPWLMYLIPYIALLVLLRKLFNFKPALSIVLPFISGIITIKLFLLYIPAYEVSLKLYFPFSLPSIYYDGKFVRAPSPEFTHIGFPLTILFITIAEVVCKSEVTVRLHLILSSVIIYVYLLQVIKKFHYKESIDEITKIITFLLLGYIMLDFYWQEPRFSYRTLSYLLMVLTSLLLLRLVYKREDARKSVFSDILVLMLLTNSIALTDLIRFIMFTVTFYIILLILKSENIINTFALSMLITLVTPGIAWIVYNSTTYIPYFMSYIKIILDDIKTFIINVVYRQGIVTETLEAFKEGYRGTSHDFTFAVGFNLLFLFSQLLIILLCLKKVRTSSCLISVKILNLLAVIILIGYLVKAAAAYTGTLKTFIGDISDVIIRFYVPTLSTLSIVLLLYQNENNSCRQGKAIFHANKIEKTLILISLLIMVSLHGIVMQNWRPKSYLDPLNHDSDWRIISNVLPTTFKFLTENVNAPAYIAASEDAEVIFKFIKTYFYANHLIANTLTLDDKNLPKINICFQKFIKYCNLIYSNKYYTINDC